MTPSKPLCVDIVEDVFTLSALADAHLNLALVWREHLSGIIFNILSLFHKCMYSAVFYLIPGGSPLSVDNLLKPLWY
jgi:hypothetical protein